MSTETLHLEYLDGKTITVITLNDPAHANAMSPEMGDAFSRAVRDIQREAMSGPSSFAARARTSALNPQLSQALSTTRRRRVFS